jgi:tetratricopeptide (TPR) repeat protein
MAVVGLGLVLLLVEPAGGATAPRDTGESLAVAKLAELSAQIAKEPGNLQLYLKRAELHRQRGDRDAALADLELAAEMPGGAERAHLAAAEVALQGERPALALDKADQLLALRPDHADGLMLRARSLAALGRTRQAVESYERAARFLAPSPDQYFECARLLASLGRAQLPRALEILDRGIDKLGPIVSLETPAIEYELQLRRFDRALARVDALMQATPRKDQLLRRRGEILLRAGRRAEARQTFARALETLRARGPAFLNSPRERTFERELEALVRGRR